MADYWRNYESILDVAIFDVEATSQRVVQLDTTAKTDGVELNAPVGIVIGGVCSLALTIEQVDALIDRLSAARRDAARRVTERRPGGMTS